jgi:hypothetical protein
MPDKKVKLFIDSGAYSAWTQNAEINLQDYIDFCLQHIDMFECVANLDVIPGKPYVRLTAQDIEDSAKQGWDNYRIMLKAGIPKEKLIHAFHQGEDVKWLKRMVKEIPYIALSPSKDKNTEEKIQWLDYCMNYVTDKDGMPLVKFHGFGTTSIKIMLRYSWFSVDSTSWIFRGRVGAVYIPRFRNGSWVYDESNWMITVSNRSPHVKEKDRHFTTFPPSVQKQFLNYFALKGFKLGKSEFSREKATYKLKELERWLSKEENGYREVEHIIEPGLSNDYRMRDEANIIYFLDLESHLPKWPWAFQKRGSMGFGL